MFGKPPGQPTLSKVLFFFKQRSPSKAKIYHQAHRPNERYYLLRARYRFSAKVWCPFSE